MANDANQVQVAVSGAVSKVALDTVITSAETDISAVGTINYGFCTDAGVTIATDTSTSNITAWQNSSVVRVVTTEASVTYTFTLLQNSKEARELYYAGTEVNGVIRYKPSASTRGRFVIDWLDTAYGSEGQFMYSRHVINKGQVTSRGDITLAGGEAVAYEVTITAFPDEDGVCADVMNEVSVIVPEGE